MERNRGQDGYAGFDQLVYTGGSYRVLGSCRHPKPNTIKEEI